MSNDLMVFNFFKTVESPYCGAMNLFKRYELHEKSGNVLEIKYQWLDVGNNENERIYFAAMDAKNLIVSYLQDGDFEKANELGQLLEDAYLSRHCQSGGKESVPRLSDFEDILHGVLLIGQGGEMVGPWRLELDFQRW
ncbi:MAG: hypothetical protein ACXVBQ_17020 [Pseudobdellovibrionaceae bacterium]